MCTDFVSFMRLMGSLCTTKVQTDIAESLGMGTGLLVIDVDRETPLCVGCGDLKEKQVENSDYYDTKRVPSTIEKAVDLILVGKLSIDYLKNMSPAQCLWTAEELESCTYMIN